MTPPICRRELRRLFVFHTRQFLHPSRCVWCVWAVFNGALPPPRVLALSAGTNVHEAKRILSESGLPITAAENLDDAAIKAVAAIRK